MAGHFTEIYEGNARSLVFGEGSFHSRLMMIGEAPGEQETLKGRPFVGKAGKYLDDFLQMRGLKREIALVAPDCIATLGNVPLKALAGDRVVIGDVHGQFLECEGRVLYPLYHPASLIYNPSLRGVYAEDVKRLGDWLRNRENG